VGTRTIVQTRIALEILLPRQLATGTAIACSSKAQTPCPALATLRESAPESPDALNKKTTRCAQVRRSPRCQDRASPRPIADFSLPLGQAAWRGGPTSVTKETLGPGRRSRPCRGPGRLTLRSRNEIISRTPNEPPLVLSIRVRRAGRKEAKPPTFSFISIPRRSPSFFSAGWPRVELFRPKGVPAHVALGCASRRGVPIPAGTGQWTSCGKHRHFFPARCPLLLSTMVFPVKSQITSVRPVFFIPSLEISGAFPRWRHPRRSITVPATFVALFAGWGRAGRTSFEPANEPGQSPMPAVIILKRLLGRARWVVPDFVSPGGGTMPARFLVWAGARRRHGNVEKWRRRSPAGHAPIASRRHGPALQRNRAVGFFFPAPHRRRPRGRVRSPDFPGGRDKQRVTNLRHEPVPARTGPISTPAPSPVSRNCLTQAPKAQSKSSIAVRTWGRTTNAARTGTAIFPVIIRAPGQGPVDEAPAPISPKLALLGLDVPAR